MLCRIWGVHGADYEECRLLGYSNPVRTSQEILNLRYRAQLVKDTSDLRFTRRWLWRIPSAAMWHRVALVRNDVLEEGIASNISVKRICELGTTLEVNKQLKHPIYSSEMSVLKRTTRRYITGSRHSSKVNGVLAYRSHLHDRLLGYLMTLVQSPIYSWRWWNHERTIFNNKERRTFCLSECTVNSQQQ
jgi:hypothetical protein